MSKEIVEIKQIDEGGENPKTKLFEKPLWKLTFDDYTTRILGKPKIEEYLSKSYENTVHHFTRRTSLLKDERKIVQWSVVFCDYTDHLLSSSELCKKLALGHQRKDEEKYHELEEALAKKNIYPRNEVLFHPPKKDPYPHLTQERDELDRLRKKAIEDDVRQEVLNEEFKKSEEENQ